jgi:hypothetical protein
LLATFGIVKAESQLGGVPRARFLEHRRLPGEIIREYRRGIQVVLHFGHACDVVPHQ